MEYKYEKTDQDYSYLASGRVFYSLPGHPAFPIRLASEIFPRCLAYREALYGTSYAADRQRTKGFASAVSACGIFSNWEAAGGDFETYLKKQGSSREYNRLYR